MSDAIVVRGVVKAFEGALIPALNGLDLKVPGGEMLAIMGPSGCGKSTLLHLIAALDAPDAGTIRVMEHDLSRARDLNHYRSRHIGIVFQMHNLLPSLSAAENVQVPMFESGLGARARRRRAEELLGLVGLAGKLDARPAKLSGGERQRVAIARALANEPPILLADEPTGSLDSVSGARVLDLIDRIRASRELTVVMVTHDPGVAARADRIVQMLDGRIVGERPGAAGPPQQSRPSSQEIAT